MWTMMAWLAAFAGPADEAFDALVQGRDRRALQVLRASLADDPDGANRCLLGEVALQVGRPDEALRVLEDVPEDAPCAGRAAFVQAEALRRTGQVDEAADRFGQLTDDLLSPARQPLAVRLEAWADRLLDQDPPDETTASSLFALAVRVAPEGSSRRLVLARRLAALRPSGGARAEAVRVLADAVAKADDLAPADRRLLAPLLDRRAGLQLLRPLPDDAETMAVRVAVVAGADLATRYRRTVALVQAHPDSSEAADARREVGLALADAGWRAEARELLEPLASGDDEAAPEAAWALAQLAVRGDDPGATEQLEALRDRFPAATFRNEVEALIDELRLDALRAQAAEGRFDAEAWDAEATTATAALEAAWATPDASDRAERMDALVARWPWSQEAKEALRHRALNHPDGLDWLRDRRGQGPADQVLSELQEPEIGIRTVDDGTDAGVELLTRGLEQVELRLHRIDVEGWLRAGGTPGSLGDLDVAIVAPDLTWTVPVPDEGVEARFRVPVPVPGPGLYAVTAATTDREARTLMMVTDARIVARSQGPDLAMVALRDGAPSRGARFWVRSAGQVSEVRSGGDGLARAELSGSPAVVVAETPGGPAILEVGRSFQDVDDPVRTAVDLDRPVYRPGDRVRFRALGMRAGEPLRGDWRLSLVGQSGQVYQVVRATADRAGTVQGELVVPWTSTGRRAQGARRTNLTLQALAPGRDEEITLATVPVIDEVEGGRRLAIQAEEEGAWLRVRDPDGVPVPDQPVFVVVGGDGTPTVQRTDDTGSIWLPAPPAGLPWSVSASLPDEAARVAYVRPDPESPELGLRLDDPRATPGQPVSVTLEGEGPAQLRVVRRVPSRRRPEAVAAPASFDIPELQVFTAGAVAEHSQVRGDDLWETVRVQSVSLGSDHTLEGLEAGRYELVLVSPDGMTESRTARLEVREGTRVRLADAPAVGRDVAVSVDGGWSLLTAEGGRMLAAAVVPPGKARRLAVDRRWHGRVQLVATGADDQHARTVEVDAALEVELDAEASDGRWSVSGRVTDAAGNPQRAQVVVRAVDEQLIDELGSPRTVSEQLLDQTAAFDAATARAWQLLDGGWAEPLAAELLAEAKRKSERKRKRLASEGRLAESRVADVLGQSVPLEARQLGTSGAGYGAGGSSFGGKGMGQVGVRRGEATVQGSRGYTLYGAREVGLWQVVQADRDGRFTVQAPAGSPQRRWRVEAVAVVPGSVGTAEAFVEPDGRPFLAVDPLAPGWPGDVARPRVRVVNPGDSEVTVSVQGGELDESLTLGPGQVVERSVGSLAAGQEQTVSLSVGGRAAGTVQAAFPLAEGLPEGEGDIQVVVHGPEDGTVAGALALADDPAIVDEPAHAVAAARAALAALPVLTEAERREAERRMWAGVAVARDRIGSMGAADGAQALVLVAQAAEHLDLPRQIVDDAAAELRVEPQTPRERLELAYARSVAGVEVQEATVGRLLRDAEHLDADGRGKLARLLDELGTRSADGLEPADTVQWLLRGDPRRLRAEQVADLVPPPLGAPGRADWVDVVVRAIGDASGSGASGLSRSLAVDDPDAALVSWTEAVPDGAFVDEAWRWPAGVSGRVADVAHPAWGKAEEAGITCGLVDAPCRVAVGDAVAWTAPESSGGLRAHGSRNLLVATTPGAFVQWREGPMGWQAVHVEVVADAGDEDGAADLTPLGQGEVLAVAAQRERIDEPFAALLASRSSLEDWRAELRGQAARLRFAAADPDDAPAWIAAFEDLRDEVPDASIQREDVVRTARAYHRVGRPERAISVYERAIGAVFLEEAARVSEVGGLVGELAGLQALREVTLRFPAVPVVRDSEFALPDRLLGMVGAIPEAARERGVTDTELRLMAAAWDRRFVALAPDAERAPEAGLRLATGLMALDARERALAWVQRLQRAHPEHELTDRWMLLEALMLTELSRTDRAEPLLRRLAEEEVPLGGGRRGPSQLRDDARLALARLAEAERRWEAAAERYQQVRETFPEALLAAEALTLQGIGVEEPLVVAPLSQAARLKVQAANVDSVQVRAYAVDLRTVFLRDSGLPDPELVRVDGLRPAWTGTRSVGAGPFPEEHTIDLPLPGAGAWLVRLDTDGDSAVAWVLRSDLEVHHADLQGMRRLTARLRGAPVAEAQVRALGASGVVAEQTDIRGVAVVGQGAGALVQSGPHVALTDDIEPGRTGSASGARPAPRPAQPSLMDRVKGREEQRRQKRRSKYDYIGTEAAQEIEASSL